MRNRATSLAATLSEGERNRVIDTPTSPTPFDVRAHCGYYTFTLTIAASGTVSGAIDLGFLTPVAVIAPGTGNSIWVAAPISFQAAYATNGTIGRYGTVQDGTIAVLQNAIA